MLTCFMQASLMRKGQSLATVRPLLTAALQQPLLSKGVPWQRRYGRLLLEPSHRSRHRTSAAQAQPITEQPALSPQPVLSTVRARMT